MKKDLKQLNVRVMYDHIITTLNTRKTTSSGIILKSNEQGEILTRQTVLACGPNAGVSVGEEVEINVAKFPVKVKNAANGIGPDTKGDIIPPIEVIEGEPYLFISSREVKYAYVSNDNVTIS